MKRHILHDLFRNILMVVIVLLMTITASGAATNRGLAAPNDNLPAELKGVTVQDSYTGNGVNAVGEIQSVVGHVVVFREDKQYAYFAAPKDKLYERDVVYTLSASRCRFQMYSSDIATLSENTRILIKTYLNNRSTGVKSTSFVMKKGKAMFYALRLFMYKGSSMEVETPTAVSGVRGTKWGMEVVESKESASLPILVADASDLGAFRQLAQANTGGGGFTIIHSFEGAVFVTGTTGQTITLNSGQSLQSGEGGLGNPYPTPPGTLQGLLGDGGGSGGDGGSGGSGSEGGGTGDGSTITPDNSSLIQGQNQNIQTRPTNRIGYYVGMVTNHSYSGWQATLNSTPKPKDLLGDNFPQSLQPLSGSTPGKWQETGYNAYMTWGYWTQDIQWMDGGEPKSFNNKGYYVAGDVTSVMPTSISGTYSGDASGTVWTLAGTANYSGPFSMNVAFANGTGTVTNFNVSIGTPGAGVTLTGGTGTIAGSNFGVTNLTSSINGSTPGIGGSADGSFYGLNAQMVGGVWQAAAGVQRANGNFYGIKP